MFDKLMQAQQMAGEIKNRLDTISVVAEVEGGKIKISSTANKRITSVNIDPQFLASADAEELEDLLLTAMNKVLDQADNVHQTEMQSVMRNMM